MKLHIVRSTEDMIKVMIIRGIVFMHEQKASYKEEVDGLDNEAVQILASSGDEPAACGRIRFLENYAKLERIAIRKEFRGLGLGHQLVEFMLDTARQRGFTLFKMHAQAHLKDFYAQHGFRIAGDQFIEAGINHYLMIHDEKKY